MTWPERWLIISNQKPQKIVLRQAEDSCEEHETFLRDESYRRTVGFHVATRGADVCKQDLVQGWFQT